MSGDVEETLVQKKRAIEGDVSRIVKLRKSVYFGPDPDDDKRNYRRR